MRIFEQYAQMIKKTSGDKLLLGFLIFYLLDCLFIWMTDPALTSYGDALWMGFSIATTIGLGDYTVTTAAARIGAILLGIYGSVIEAYIPGLIASYYLSTLKNRRDALVMAHADELSRLDTMSGEQKRALSQTIRQEETK